MYNSEERRKRYLENREIYKHYVKEYYKDNKDMILKKYHLNKKTSLYSRIINSSVVDKKHFIYKYIPILEKYKESRHHISRYFKIEKDCIIFRFNKLTITIDNKKILKEAYNISGKKNKNLPEVRELNPESIEWLCQIFKKE